MIFNNLGVEVPSTQNIIKEVREANKAAKMGSCF